MSAALPAARTDVSNIHIDPEFRTLIPPLSRDEYAGLEADIVAHGCRDPLVLASWPDGIALADGHNRYAICTARKIPFNTITQEFPSRETVALWVKENQLSRRNLTDDQRAIISDEVRELRSKLAMSDRGRKGAGARLSTNVIDKQTETAVDIRAQVAQEHKISQRKLNYARELRTEEPELAAKVRTGELSMMDAVRVKRQASWRAAVEDLSIREAKELQGIFDVIVIDPPWPQGRLGFFETRIDCGAPLDYPVMPVTEIETLVGDKLARHADENCHIFLWTTQKFLPTAFKLIDAWGLNYSFLMVWHKDGGAKPLDLPIFNSEFVVYARKGSPKFLDTHQFFTCFEAPRGDHSEKPEQFYEVLRRVTGGRRLDLFNRRKIQGFTGWGNEADENDSQNGEEEKKCQNSI